MNAIIGILVGLLSLGLMMFLHELGHFWTGLKLGFKVEEFSIFMGPRLFSWVKNGIRYSLKLLPIGASVQFGGEYSSDIEMVGPEARAKGYFYAMPIWKRFWTIFWGPGVNLVTAFLAFVLYFNLIGQSIPVIQNLPEQGLMARAGAKVGDTLKSIEGYPIRNELDYMAAMRLYGQKDELKVLLQKADGSEVESSVTNALVDRRYLGITQELTQDTSLVKVASVSQEQNGGAPNLEVGDQILAVNGQSLKEHSLSELLEKMDEKETEVELKVLRDGREMLLQVKPIVRSERLDSRLQFTNQKGFISSIPYAWNYSVSVVKATFRILGQVFVGGVKPAEALSGPVGIVSMYSTVVGASGIDWAAKGLQLIYLFAMISLSLGIMNFLPIPPLDGSVILLLIVEKIRGKKLSPRAMEIVNGAGVFIILALAVYVLGIDLLRIFHR